MDFIYQLIHQLLALGVIDECKWPFKSLTNVFVHRFQGILNANAYSELAVHTKSKMIIFYSVPSCDHFGRHGEWKKYLATKILAKVASWRPTDLKRNLLENYQKYLTNLINSTSGSIICLSLFLPLVVQKVECINLK